MTRTFAGLLAAFCLSAPAFANNWAVVGHVTSYHFGCKPDAQWACNYNQVNPGIGLEHAQPMSSGWTVFERVGLYRDSFKDTAFYGGAGLRYRSELRDGWHTGASFMAGYLNGSGFNGVGVLPSLEVGYRQTTLEVGLIPKHVPGKSEGRAGVLTFSLRQDF